MAALTVDDGYRDTVEQALPILKTHDFTATCYLVSQRMGSYNVWDADSSDIRKPLMDWQQVYAWLAEGMEIGAHSQIHPCLTECSKPQLENEIMGCKQDLEAVLGIAITQFCYPYGNWDSRVVDVVNGLALRRQRQQNVVVRVLAALCLPFPVST